MVSVHGAPVLEKPFLMLRNFIESMNAIANRPRPPGPDISWIEYDGRKFKSLGLNDVDHGRYRDCVDALLRAIGGKPSARTISPESVDAMIRRALVDAVRPGSTAKSPRQAFDRRLARELRKIREQLSVAPREWHVVTRVHGLGQQGLPFTLGAVTFSADGAAIGRQLASEIAEASPTKRTRKKILADEKRVRERAREKIAQAFAEGTSASVRVWALDARAAKRLGLNEIGRAIDCVNYFGRFFDPLGRPRRAFVSPSGPRTRNTWAAHPSAGGELVWSDLAPSDELRVAGFDVNSERGVECGAARASALLVSTKRTDFEDRIVTAITWAGRATVEHRRDAAFISFAIALESLLTKPSSKVGVSDRFRLRTAHLVGRSPAARRTILEMMSRLYELRSALVHSGDAGELTKSDLSTISHIVDRAITTVLTDARFAGMRAADFDRWCEDGLLFGHPTAEKA